MCVCTSILVLHTWMCLNTRNTRESSENPKRIHKKGIKDIMAICSPKSHAANAKALNQKRTLT
uniref:Secreted protein n=1 Tax=Rhizophora mucronata TaxID=61149 RepID=A0A2P2QE27_RHIMU